MEEPRDQGGKETAASMLVAVAASAFAVASFLIKGRKNYEKKKNTSNFGEKKMKIRDWNH